MADLLGTPAAGKLQDDIKKRLEEYKESKLFTGKLPTLGIVRVGERADDIYYEKSAIKKIESLGMETKVFSFDKNISDDKFRKEFEKINADSDIDGILLFAPLPKTIDEKAAVEIMDPEKDLDGLCFVNQAKLYAGDTDGFAPCTAEAVIKLLDCAEVDVTGKKVTVVGRSIVIGKPVSMLLLRHDATVTICHSKTENLKDMCKEADIIVAAIGRARMIDDSYVSDGSIVIDVGINEDETGQICGDVDYDSVSKKASLITPVPRGVGSVTTSVLAEHLLSAAIFSANKNKEGL